MGIQSRTSGLQVHYSIHSTTQICNFAIRQGRRNFEKIRMCSKLGLNNNLKSLKLKIAVDKIMKLPRFLTRRTSSLFTFYCHRTDLENPFLTMIRITMTRTWGSRTPGVKTQRYNDKLQDVIFVARLRRKAWCLDTRGFILKKIQWHIHAGSWSLVNSWREALTRHYIRCS